MLRAIQLQLLVRAVPGVPLLIIPQRGVGKGNGDQQQCDQVR